MNAQPDGATNFGDRSERGMRRSPTPLAPSLRDFSLRQRLLRSLWVPLLAVAILSSVAQYGMTVQATQRAMDQALLEEATGIGRALLAQPSAVYATQLVATLNAYLRADAKDPAAFAIRDSKGALLAGERELADLKLALEPTGPTYRDVHYRGAMTRIAVVPFACQAARPCEVRSIEPHDKRAAAHRQAGILALMTFGVFAGLIFLLTPVVVRHCLTALASVRGLIVSRSVAQLAPLATEGAPAELLPIIEGLNEVIGRLAQVTQSQQQFIADAAHQLRTPLAALSVRIEVAIREAVKGIPCPEALGEISAIAQRANRLANQLLVMARSEQAASEIAVLDEIDLKPLASELATEWGASPLLIDQDLGFELNTAPCWGRSHLLREALTNLLHNAVMYAGPQARITLRTRMTENEAIAEVEDDGPGIAPHLRERVVQRFVRGDNSTGTGSGLGLAIVKDIATLHRGVLVIMASNSTDPTSNRDGLIVQLRLPLRRIASVAAPAASD
jgi:two-component system, OmpR family, sensor histidine kinase TctE